MIVCDTGPLLHLSEAGAIHLLPLAGEILIPSLVAIEFEANTQDWRPPQWIRIVDLEKSAQKKAEKWVRENQIDAGEAEAIALAVQEHADWLLTDDTQARQFAESAGLEVHGSIGLLLWSVSNEHILEKSIALQLLDNLASSSLWISERVLREARKAINILFD